MAHTVTGATPYSTDRTSFSPSPAKLAFSVFATSVLLVFVLTMVLIMTLADIPLVAAGGFAAFCAFWLGAGFGTIFAAAAVFGREH